MNNLGALNTMVPSELTRRVNMGELLVLLVCWKSGPYGVCVDLVSRGKGPFAERPNYQVPQLVPPPPRHLITKLKGSTESHFCTPRFPPVPLAEKISKGFNAVATRGRCSRPL
jgi:hypothetical protein